MPGARSTRRRPVPGRRARAVVVVILDASLAARRRFRRAAAGTGPALPALSRVRDQRTAPSASTRPSSSSSSSSTSIAPAERGCRAARCGGRACRSGRLDECLDGQGERSSRQARRLKPSRHRLRAYLTFHRGEGAQATPSRANTFTDAASVALRRPPTGSSWRSSARSASPATWSTSPSTRRCSRFDVHYLVAAACSFLVAVTNNYLWNRIWTFRRQRGPPRPPGLPLPARLDRRARRQPRLPERARRARRPEAPGAGDRDRPRDAVELRRQQALELPTAALRVAVARARRAGPRGGRARGRPRPRPSTTPTAT